MPLKVLALGTGNCSNGYAPNTDRKPPGFLVDVDGILILLDCSEGIRYRLQEKGYEYGLVQHVAVTHGHPDHACLPQFLQAKSCRRLWGKDQPEFGVCTVYMPSKLVKGFQTVWNWHQPENDGKYWPEFTPRFIAMGQGSAVGIAPDITLKSFPVYHGFGKHPAVAYRLETPHGVITYSGDSAVCDGLVEAARNADLFICEQSFRIGYKDTARYGHLTPREVGEVCKRAGVEKVRLTHYVGLDKASDVLAEIKKGGFKGDVKHAKDGDEWMLK